MRAYIDVSQRVVDGPEPQLRVYRTAQDVCLVEYASVPETYSVLVWNLRRDLTISQILNAFYWTVLRKLLTEGRIRLTVLSGTAATFEATFEQGAAPVIKATEEIFESCAELGQKVELLTLATRPAVLEVSFDTARGTPARLAVAIHSEPLLAIAPFIALFNSDPSLRESSSELEERLREFHPMACVPTRARAEEMYAELP